MSQLNKKFVNTLPRGGEEMCSPADFPDSSSNESGSEIDASEPDDESIVIMGDRDLLPGFPIVNTDTRVRLIARKILCTEPHPILLFGMQRNKNNYGFFEVKGPLDVRGISGLASELFGDYEYNGYCRDGNDVYAVVTCNASFIACDVSVTWHVSSEILNQKHSFGLPFSRNAIEFFYNHASFLHQQERTAILPAPTVWYLPSNGEDLITLRCRGPERGDVDSEIGPFYRLFSYEKALLMSDYQFIVRYAVFESNVVCGQVEDPEWWKRGEQLISKDGSTLTLVRSDHVHFIEYDEHHSSDSSPAGAPSTNL